MSTYICSPSLVHSMASVYRCYHNFTCYVLSIVTYSHELLHQGAELMGKFGINVPKGVAVSSVEEVRKAIQTTFPNEKEVSFHINSFCLCNQH